MKKIVLAIALLTVSKTEVIAQGDKSTTVIIFNDDKKQVSLKERRKKSRENETNIIKIAPLGFLSGTFPIYYERKFSDLFSVQLGFGITSTNYFRLFTYTGGERNVEITYPWTNSNLYDQSQDLSESKNLIYKSGTLFSIQPRLYLSNEALEGSFMGISYDSYSYTIVAKKGVLSTGGSSLSFTGVDVDQTETFRDIMVSFGGQWINNHISIEAGTALGVRKVSGQKYCATIEAGKLVDGLGAYSFDKINYNVFFKVGYVF
jgi:hypothetical protein